MYYFDANATTKVDKRVKEYIMPYFEEFFYNPSALYEGSQKVRAAIAESRSKIANLLNAKFNEIIFNSGATEGNNTVLKTFLQKYPNSHIITTKIEHSSVLNTAKFLEFQGVEVSFLDVDENGVVDLEQLKRLIKKNTKLVSIMYVNNETGVIQPVEKVREIIGDEIYFHIDAVQAVGKVNIDVKKLQCDYLTISGHKFHAPKGVGVLYAREDAPFMPLIHGGGQESYKRAGTENVIGILAIARALELTLSEMKEVNTKLRNYQQLIETTLKREFGEKIIINGEKANRVCNTSNVGFEGLESNALIKACDLRNIAVSSGSACSAGLAHESHVLSAMGIDQKKYGILRISTDKFIDYDIINYFLENLIDIVKKMYNNF